MIQSEDEVYQCTPELVLADVEESIQLAPVTFDGTITPLLESITPRFGSRLGGETITFRGQNFSATKSKYTILIDGVPCVASSTTTSSIRCTTGARDDLVEASLSILIEGTGLVALNEKKFLYVYKWSDGDQTWGGELEPMDGETIVIPTGMNLLVDIDASPKLMAVFVFGGLIFPSHTDPTHQRTFNAHYIFVHEGYMEAGTEEFPYTSKITITMHSKIDDPYLPIYGNKCIGLRFGTLDLHGIPKEPTWTTMESTVEAGATQI